MVAEFENILPDDVRQRAARWTNGEVGWYIDDMETVIEALTKADLAVRWMEVWAVLANTKEGWEIFRDERWDSVPNDRHPQGYIPPLSGSVDGRVVWGILPMKEGGSGVLGMASGAKPNNGESWSEFVQRQASLTLRIVSETKKDVVASLEDKLHFEIEVMAEEDVAIS